MLFLAAQSTRTYNFWYITRSGLWWSFFDFVWSQIDGGERSI